MHARFSVCSTSSKTDSSTNSLKVWVTAVTFTRKQPAFLHKEPFGTTGSRAKYLGTLKCLATSVRKNNKPSRGEGIEAAESLRHGGSPLERQHYSVVESELSSSCTDNKPSMDFVPRSRIPLVHGSGGTLVSTGKKIPIGTKSLKESLQLRKLNRRQ